MQTTLRQKSRIEDCLFCAI